ncbi:glycosyltransferase family 4 protein [Pseudanabaenaceae cyanobacterium LEGE 13415]|nr:glycosyltransferase family 4 protein [Pseudanabaenaceae cyanobacterium LEGE 13415]
MKIAIAMGPWLPVPAIQGGAVNRRWQGVAEEFAALGHEVIMLCRSFPGQPSIEVVNGVHYVRRGGFTWTTKIWIDLIKDLTYALTTAPTLPAADVLIINDFWLPVFAPLHPNIKKVVVNVGRFPKGQYFLYGQVDRFAVASHAMETAIAAQYPSAISRMKVVPNPISTTVFQPGATVRQNREEKVILYVGRVHREKGLHLLIAAFALISQAFPTVRLRIIGPIETHQGGGGENYFNQLKQQAEGLKVEFVAPIFNPEALAKAYQEADLFCYPSLAEKGEAFGVAPLEAMATGLVPIVSNLDCFKDFIEDQTTGFFFDHRTSEATENLAAVFKRSLSNWEQTRSMGTKARQQAEQFSYRNIAKRYLADFEQLLESNKEVARQHG